MPRYFFNICGAARLDDDEDTELQDSDTARLQAVAFAGAWIADRPCLLSEHRKLEVEVRNDQGDFISIVTISVTGMPHIGGSGGERPFNCKDNRPSRRDADRRPWRR